MAFLITILAGLFFGIGAFISLISTKKKKLVELSLGLAFSVLIFILFDDIIPSAIEFLSGHNKYLIIICAFIGVVLLKLLDILVPHHDHEAEVKHHENHLKHIGLISSITLMLHNIIEGISIYTVATTNIKAGLLLALGVGMHNIPFGIEITSALNETKKNTSEIMLNIALLTLSTVFGAIIVLIMGNVSDLSLGILLSITIGMIIYLILFELMNELLNIKNKKNVITGILLGLIFMVISVLFGG